MEPKKVSASAIEEQTVTVFPDDLNAYGTLFGGRVMELCDGLASIVARRHSGKICVTLGIDSVRFLCPAKHGDLLVLKASVNRAWNTSMEVGVKVFKEEFKTEKLVHIVSAYFTFVAMDDEDRPTKVPAIIPETEEQQRRFKEADQRRNARLHH